MTFKLTVLGSCGGYARPGRACSGYLFELGDSDLVLDIGAGALSNMLKYVEADALDYLVITHLHYDHYVDVYGLLTARRFWERALPPLPVLAPAGTRQVVGEALSPESREEFLSCMEFIDAEDRVPVRFAGFEILPYEAAHSVPAFGYRITAGGGPSAIRVIRTGANCWSRWPVVQTYSYARLLSRARSRRRYPGTSRRPRREILPPKRA